MDATDCSHLLGLYEMTESMHFYGLTIPVGELIYIVKAEYAGVSKSLKSIYEVKFLLANGELIEVPLGMHLRDENCFERMQRIQP